MREAHAVSNLNHPNICTVHDVADTEIGEQYIVMELCVGRRLDELITENALSYDSIFRITEQLSAALATAHNKNILHRDLKPQNVIIDDDLHVKLLDFGIAKIVGAEGSANSQALGTVAYMSPEQFTAGNQDQRADVWALGTLFFELLTGATPFSGKTQPEVMRAIFDQKRPSLREIGSELPEQFEQFFDSCLAYKMHDRLPTMREFHSALGGLRSAFPDVESLNGKPHYARAANGFTNTAHSSQNERRNVTILHFRALTADGMDPEDRASTLDQISEVFQKIIRRFGAYQFSNSASELAAYFGYPKADEHSTIQAVRCALALKEATLRRQGSSHLPAYSAQIAVHTDLMIARNTDTSSGVELIGDGPAVAQNLSFNAAPNQVLISHITAELVEGFFSLTNLNTSFGKVAEVLGESTAKSKFDVALASGLSPLRGRVHEIGMLREAWQQAIENDGRVIAISGDAGIGKSRLIHELKEQVADSADAWLVECQCSPYESNTTLYPVIHYFKTQVLQFSDDLSEDERTSRVIGFLTEYGFDEEDISILAEIFDAPIQPSTNALVSPDQRHAVIFSGLAKLLKQRASYQPVLVIFEDLHWADASTNKLIERLLQERLPSNLLLLLTFRPGYKPRWLTTENVTRLVVQRLSKKDSGSLIETVYGGEKMDEKIRVRLMEKTDGNPLFIETLTRSVTERGKSSIESIPNSLHDSLAARLDQLGPSKLVAQHAAVIGREFTFSLLNECLDIAPNLLESSLRQLTEAQLITTPADEHESYRFKHALIRDSAYDSLLKADKTAIHGVIAKALSSNPNVSPALLDNHYDLAGLYEDAALCWLDAAKTALNQAAAREAFGLCEKGLAAIDRATPSDPVTHTKIELLLTLGPAVIATRGYTDHRLEKAYAEALTLSQELGANDRSFTALFGTFTFNIVSAKHEKAHQVTKHLTEIAQSTG